MPVLFIGHGSPMNAIEENEFVEGWRNIGRSLPRPEAILCISAHWETKGTFVTAMDKPKTIHDFGGFPPELYKVQYPASGKPELAHETKSMITGTAVVLDDSWGLDHGCWSPVKHLYPNADIPVVQMSLDYSRSPQYHYDLAAELSPLREKGVLIIGSGNMVHNLGMVDWRRINEAGFGYDWAVEANEKIKSLEKEAKKKTDEIEAQKHKIEKYIEDSKTQAAEIAELKKKLKETDSDFAKSYETMYKMLESTEQ